MLNRWNFLKTGFYEGINNDKQLVFVGQVATNLSKPVTEELYATLNEIHTSESPFETAPGIQKLIYELVSEVRDW